MKFKLILLIFFIFSKTLFATHNGYIETYIPIANPQALLLEKEGIELRKVLFFTYSSIEESSIGSVVWSYKANTPHTRYKNREANLGHIQGLKVDLTYSRSASCKVTIDSRNIISKYRGKTLDKILKYVEKATRLNMKESHLNCKVKILKTPISIRQFQPKALNLDVLNVKAFPTYKSGFKEAQFVQDTFYPLGYSANNRKFAYIIEHDSDPADFVYIETFIQDLVTDKIIWHNSYRVDDYQKRVNFKIFWKQRYALIEKQLANYGIRPTSIVVKANHTFHKHDKFWLSYKMATYYSKDWASNFLTVSTIYLNAKRKGHKTINERFYKKGTQVLARKPMAFLPSFKNLKRVAILVGDIRRGWEDPPHNLHYEIVGANLMVGFQK